MIPALYDEYASEHDSAAANVKRHSFIAADDLISAEAMSIAAKQITVTVRVIRSICGEATNESDENFSLEEIIPARLPAQNAAQNAAKMSAGVRFLSDKKSLIFLMMLFAWFKMSSDDKKFINGCYNI